MRLLLQLSLAAADDGSVLERADTCSSIVSRRVLLVERFVRGHRRTLPHRNVPQRYVNAEYLRLLRGDSVSYADSATEQRSYSAAD